LSSDNDTFKLEELYISLSKSEAFGHDEKELAKKVFNIDKSLSELEFAHAKAKDEMQKKLYAASELAKIKEKKTDYKDLDIKQMYKQSLKEDDVQQKISDELGLRDVYYKPRKDPKAVLRTSEHNIPLNYFINEDGFWDSYIKEKQSQIDISLYTHKPLNIKKDRIKKKKL
jgi:hypothetical protein